MEQHVQNVTCVQCPMGCSLSVYIDSAGAVTNVEGNSCPRGKAYGAAEVTHPVRMVTSLMRVENTFHPISVRTAEAVPRETIPAVLVAIHNTTVKVPVQAGEVLIQNVANTGIDVVATKSCTTPL